MRFDSLEHFKLESGEMYDNVYGSINHALPTRWFADDSPECDRYITKKEYEDSKNILFLIQNSILL